MKTKTLITALTAAAALTAGSASAAIIEVADYTISPDGSNTIFEEAVDVATPNSGNVLPNGGTSVVYWVGTYNFGTDSNVHMAAHFVASLNFLQDRVGVAINDDGLVTVFGGGPLQANSSFNLAQDLAGQSVTVMVKLDYDVNRNLSNDDDTLMEVWVNPTVPDTESSADMEHIWNSANFPGFNRRIENQSTMNSAGDSSITDVVILTGTDATFQNAYEIAVPEPASLALLGLGGLLLAGRNRK